MSRRGDQTPDCTCTRTLPLTRSGPPYRHSDERPRVLCANQLCLDPASDLSQRGPIKDKDVLHLVLVPEPNLPSLYAHLGTQGDADRARAYGLAGSLYARCGGIFGVASFVDRCMDAWMADPTLNANDAVATWHQRAQRCGFKFLVTQLMGYLCGGPQVYTGRGMAASHKHLGIREEEWASFMEGLQEVCDELGLPKQEVDDVRAVIASMQADCVVADGEAVPPNPGHPAPAGDSLYARLGGAYPVALFCDRLVDALLSDRTVKIPLDAKRNEASLKYLFTELVCSIAGGPETMTAPSLLEARLLCSSKELFQLLRCAEAASVRRPPGARTPGPAGCPSIWSRTRASPGMGASGAAPASRVRGAHGACRWRPRDPADGACCSRAPPPPCRDRTTCGHRPRAPS